MKERSGRSTPFPIGRDLPQAREILKKQRPAVGEGGLLPHDLFIAADSRQRGLTDRSASRAEAPDQSAAAAAGRVTSPGVRRRCRPARCPLPHAPRSSCGSPPPSLHFTAQLLRAAKGRPKGAGSAAWISTKRQTSARHDPGPEKKASWRLTPPMPAMAVRGTDVQLVELPCASKLRIASRRDPDPCTDADLKSGGCTRWHQF